MLTCRVSNLVYVALFLSIELCLVLDASSYFATADGNPDTGKALMKAAGVFGFIAGLIGYYCVAHYMCQDVLPFRVPMGDTSRFFQLRCKKEEEV